MAEQRNSLVEVRRILVLADSSRASRAALEAAAELAAHHDTELISLFVEESDLLRLAGLPFAREVGTTSGASRPLDRERLERRLKGEVAGLRRKLARLAARHTIRWSLQIARGHADMEALARTMPGDLLVVGKTGWSRLPHQQLGSTPRNLINRAEVSVMVYSQSERAPETPIVALFDDPARGPRTLALATYLARAGLDTLTVLFPEPDAGQLMSEARRWLATHGMEAGIKPLRGRGPEALVAAALREHSRALVVHRDSPLLTKETRQRLLEELDAPVVIVS